FGSGSGSREIAGQSAAPRCTGVAASPLASKWRTRCAVAIAVLLVGRSALAQTPPLSPDGTPFQIRLSIDMPAIGGAAFLWTMPTLVLSDQIHPPACNPCDPQEVNAFDRWFIQFHNEGAGLASNFLYAVPPVVWLVNELVDLGVRKPGAFFVDLTVIAQT